MMCPEAQVIDELSMMMTVCLPFSVSIGLAIAEVITESISEFRFNLFVQVH